MVAIMKRIGATSGFGKPQLPASHDVAGQGGALPLMARILLSLAALLMLHWSSNVPGPGWLDGDEAGARTIERTVPGVLAEAGRPVAVKQRQAEEPDLASGGKHTTGFRAGSEHIAGRGDTSFFRQPVDVGPVSNPYRAYDARGPPRRA